MDLLKLGTNTKLTIETRIAPCRFKDIRAEGASENDLEDLIVLGVQTR